MIPTKAENPKGLHLRYTIAKRDGSPIDPRAEYFILRLDEYCSDPKHTAACRAAILTYANEIKDHLPELALDLMERYSLTKGASAKELQAPMTPEAQCLIPVAEAQIKIFVVAKKRLEEDRADGMRLLKLADQHQRMLQKWYDELNGYGLINADEKALIEEALK